MGLVLRRSRRDHGPARGDLGGCRASFRHRFRGCRLRPAERAQSRARHQHARCSASRATTAGRSARSGPPKPRREASTTSPSSRTLCSGRWWRRASPRTRTSCSRRTPTASRSATSRSRRSSTTTPQRRARTRPRCGSASTGGSPTLPRTSRRLRASPPRPTRCSTSARRGGNGARRAATRTRSVNRVASHRRC